MTSSGPQKIIEMHGQRKLVETLGNLVTLVIIAIAGGLAPLGIKTYTCTVMSMGRI